MKHFKLVVLVGLVTVFSIAGIAFAQGGGQGKAGQGAAPMMGCQQRFDAMDTNKDGQVSKDEFLAAPHQRENHETFETSCAGWIGDSVFHCRYGICPGWRSG